MTSIDNVVEATEKLLNNLKVSYTQDYLSSEISSHPYYPSLVSISDVLDRYKVSNYAIKTEFQELPKIKSPFIAHLTISQGLFAFVESVSELEIRVYCDGSAVSYTREKFVDIWDGIVFVVDRNDESGEPDYVKHKNKKRNVVLKAASFIALVFGFISVSMILDNSILTLIPIFIVQGLGLFFTWLLTKHEFGQTNKIVDKLCTASKSAGCNEVLQSKGSNLFGKISLADIGVIWMTSSTLFLIIAAIVSTNVPPFLDLFGWCLFFSIPMICFSIAYQVFVVKKYCPLCIGVMSTLLINIGLMWFHYKFRFGIPDYSSIISLSFILAISLFVWYSVKRLIHDSIDFADLKSKHLRLKRNPEVIAVLQAEQKTVEIPSAHLPLKITNHNSDIVITEVINLYCSPCKNAFEKIDIFLSQFPDNSIDVQFILAAHDGDEVMKKTAEHLLALYEQGDKQRIRAAMKSWYQLKNYEEWSWEFPAVIEDRHKKMLLQHIEWSDKNEIAGTPTIFVNDKEMSNKLDFSDLLYLLN